MVALLRDPIIESRTTVVATEPSDGLSVFLGTDPHSRVTESRPTLVPFPVARMLTWNEYSASVAIRVGRL